MLLDIARAATAENSALLLHPSDNIAVARVPLAAGQQREPAHMVPRSL